MRKIRIGVAAVVAVAMLSFGAASCTPQQAAGAGEAFEELIGMMLAAWLLSFIPPNPAPTGGPPTTVTITVPSTPVGT